MTATVMWGGIIYFQISWNKYWHPQANGLMKADTADLVRSLLTLCMLVLTVIIVEECVRKWLGILSGRKALWLRRKHCTDHREPVQAWMNCSQDNVNK